MEHINASYNEIYFKSEPITDGYMHEATLETTGSFHEPYCSFILGTNNEVCNINIHVTK